MVSYPRLMVLHITFFSEDTSERWSPLKQHSTPQYLERRTRLRKSREFSNNRRATSQDRSFPSLNWRRKSEPGIVHTYTSKTLPKKITKLKKNKDQTAKFYMDLSDCEHSEAATESLEERCEDIQESSLETEAETTKIASSTLEKVVSDLLMQNEEFHKLLNRQRRSIRDSEPEPGIWLKQEPAQLPSKADSLPRDFQLNDQLESASVGCTEKSGTLPFHRKQVDVEIEDIPEK